MFEDEECSGIGKFTIWFRCNSITILTERIILLCVIFFKEFATDPVLIWTPVIEGDYGQQRFLPDHPVNIINSGKFAKVPFISGVTSDEFGDRAFSKLQLHFFKVFKTQNF